MPLNDLSAVAVAVFDHGDAPPGMSDRQFRFDYLDERIREQLRHRKNPLSAFAFSRDRHSCHHDPPSGGCPVCRKIWIVLSLSWTPLLLPFWVPHSTLSSPAKGKIIIANVGNFHTLAFRLGEKPGGGESCIEGLFEHHTGEIDLPKLESLLRRLADGTLKHQDVFDDMGHGALMYDSTPLPSEKAILI